MDFVFVKNGDPMFRRKGYSLIFCQKWSVFETARSKKPEFGFIYYDIDYHLIFIQGVDKNSPNFEV